MMPNSNAQKRRKKYKTNSNYVQVRRMRHMVCVLGYEYGLSGVSYVVPVTVPSSNVMGSYLIFVLTPILLSSISSRRSSRSSG
jgi:hypothetical protein